MNEGRNRIVIKTEQQVTIAPKVAKKLLTELNGYAAITAEIKALDEAKKGHTQAVLELSEQVDGDKYTLEGYKVAVVKGATDSRLDKEKLLKRLVADGHYSLKSAQALLSDVTVTKSKRDHVRISVPGERGDNDN